MISLYSGIKHEIVSERLKAGEIVGCGSFVPPLTQAAVDKTPRIVAQMGPEPFVQAMTENPDFDIIIGGRGYDPAPYIAWCVYNALKKSGGNIYGLEKTALGAFAHMGKLLECECPQSPRPHQGQSAIGLGKAVANVSQVVGK